MGGIGRDPVAQVDHRGDPGRGERAAGIDQRPRAPVSGDQALARAERKLDVASTEQREPRGRAAEGAGDADAIAGAGAVAPHEGGLVCGLAHDRHRHDDQLALADIAARDLGARGGGQVQERVDELDRPLPVARDDERHVELAGRGAHRGEVGERTRQRLVPDIGGGVGVTPEVDVLDDRVDRYRLEAGRPDHRGVVARPAQEPTGRRRQRGANVGDQIALGHGYSLTTVAATTRRAQLVRLVVVTTIVASIVVFVVTQVTKLPSVDWRPRPGWLAVAVAFEASFYLLQAQAWLMILGRLDQPIDPRQGRAAWCKSLLARYVPTSTLMVVGRVVLAGRLGVPRRVALASVAYELGIGITAALIVGSYTLIGLPDLADQPLRFLVLAFIAVALVGLHPRIFKPLADRALRRLGRPTLPQALPYGSVLAMLSLYLVVWVLAGLAVLAFTAAAVPIPEGDWASIAAAQPAAFVAGLAFVVFPAGLGARDAVLAAGLAVVFPLGTAVAVAVGFRLFQVTLELLIAATLSWRARRIAAPQI